MTYLLLENIIPLIMLAASALIITVVAMIKRNHLMINRLTIVLLAVTALVLVYMPENSVQNAWLFGADSFGRLIQSFIIMAAGIVTVMSYPYLQQQDINREEYYILILLATLGACALAVSRHFISFLVSLELLSVSLYVLIGYLTFWDDVVEAAVKYLVLAAVSSAVLLMGMAFLYAATGSMDFTTLGDRIALSMQDDSVFILAGAGLMIAGAGFKMAVVPFHMWAPDVYQGSPAPVAGFIASASKGAIVALLFRFLINTNSHGSHTLLMILSVIAVLSMVAGNILALFQQNVKRILGYSSIAHFGYILVAMIAGGSMGTEALSFYLLAYMVSILGAFGLITQLSETGGEPQHLSDYRGMFWHSPLRALIFTVMLFSLAGIPLTAGFIGKFYVLLAGIHEAYWVLSIVLIITSVIGLFYYLRIIVELFKARDSRETLPARSNVISGGGFMLIILLLLVLWLGVLPGYASDLISYLVHTFIQ